MVYDQTRNEMLMFGGRDDSLTKFTDTWRYTPGGGWVDAAPVSNPDGRTNFGMAYDVTNANVVLFGGSAFSASNDTWLWDGTDWTQVFPALSPPPCFNAQLAFCALTGLVVMLHEDGDTYSWDGTNWILESPSSVPGLRAGQGFGSTSDGYVVMFGGDKTGLSGSWGDTWLWDGDWHLQTVAGTPEAGLSANIDNSILFGNEYIDGTGNFNGNKTWQWVGTGWNELLDATKYNISGVNPMVVQDGRCMAYDLSLDHVVMFGGSDEDSGLVGNRTYMLDLS